MRREVTWNRVLECRKCVVFEYESSPPRMYLYYCLVPIRPYGTAMAEDKRQKIARLIWRKRVDSKLIEGEMEGVYVMQHHCIESRSS